MASSSLLGAIQQRYDTLTFTPRPTIYVGEAPYRDGSGVAVVPPYIVLHDDGQEEIHEFEYSVGEITSVRFEVYALGLALAEAIVLGLRFNGAAVNAGSGMDFASSLPVTGQTFKAMVYAGQQHDVENARDGSATDVHKITVRYRVQTHRV